MNDCSTKPFRVLSLDGGGMRGLYTSVLLDRLTRRFEDDRGVPRGTLDVGKGFDLIVGTSTGGIIACGLAAGIPTGDLIALYQKAGPRIFRDPMPRHQLSLAMWLARHLNSAANDSSALAGALRERFGAQTLGDIYASRNIALCITSVNMKTQRSWVFKTPHEVGRRRDADYKLVDVCLATSAAPLYFPLACVADPLNPIAHYAFVDGGLWANNPVIIGLVEALEVAQSDQPIEIISVSTCAPPSGEPISALRPSWGVMKWRAGSKALTASLCAQSSRYTGIAKVLTDHLTQPCRILRLEGSAPSADQAQHMDLDATTDESADVLTNLACFDADKYFGAARAAVRGDIPVGKAARRMDDFSLLRDAFTGMPRRCGNESAGLAGALSPSRTVHLSSAAP